MNDDLDDLKAAMRMATPTVDPSKKTADLGLAQKNFAQLQETRAGTRLTSDRPRRGICRGVIDMFSSLTTRGALTATTALAAFGLILIIPGVIPDTSPLSRMQPTPEVVKQTPPDPARDIQPENHRLEQETLLNAENELVGARSDRREMPNATAEPNAVVLGQLDDKAEADNAPAEYRARELNDANSQDTVAGQAKEQFAAAPVPNLIAPPVADLAKPIAPTTEAYPQTTPNPLKITTTEPVSTFSIDVDTASYAVVRSSLGNGQLPPKGAVRIEEMVNYFPYAYPAPAAAEAPFRPTVTVTGTPWNPETQLVHIAIQGQKPETDERPPLNLVFLIDTSGSMNSANKLPLLKQSLALMLPQLRPQDQVAIVAYAGSAGQVLAPTPATERATILNALERLGAGGSTAGQAGLQQAYAVAENMAEDGEVTRIVLATDGDFNVGLSDPEALKDFIAQKRETGTYLSVMGFGRGNLDDATMQALAQNGNGQASFIDTLSEAQKMLVDQFSGALFPIANDVKVQVEFNPAKIAEYRLLGYETRALKRQDFNNDNVDAGDIGAGHSVTAIYEVTPVDSPSRLTDPLRYQPSEVANSADELGYLKLRYKTPGASASQLIETPILPGGAASDDMRFAIAIAGFGQLLSNRTYLGDWSYDEAISQANASKGEDGFGYRAEAIRLMRLAKSLSQ